MLLDVGDTDSHDWLGHTDFKAMAVPQNATVVPHNTTTNTTVSASSGLSGGAIAGIAVGTVAAVALIAVAVLFLARRRNKGVPKGGAAVGGRWELGGGSGTGQHMVSGSTSHPSYIHPFAGVMMVGCRRVCFDLVPNTTVVVGMHGMLNAVACSCCFVITR